MPVSSRAAVDFILLGPTHDRRQLQDSYEIHLIYPVEDIDEARRKDWATEQGKERGRQAKNPGARIRPDWSPADNSLRAFFAAHPDMARRVRVVDADAAHVIDLLQPLGM